MLTGTKIRVALALYLLTDYKYINMQVLGDLYMQSTNSFMNQCIKDLFISSFHYSYPEVIQNVV